jgi:hypothetical protein
MGTAPMMQPMGQSNMATMNMVNQQGMNVASMNMVSAEIMGFPYTFNLRKKGVNFSKCTKRRVQALSLTCQ